MFTDAGGAEKPHLQWTHHHMVVSEASRPITTLAAEEGAELQRSELQHLKVKLETWKKVQQKRQLTYTSYLSIYLSKM